MIDGARLKETLEARGMSQSELARRVGVSQPTIYRAASGKQYGTRTLHRIARELGTTPAYLTGETDDPDEDAPTAPEFSHDERQLVDCYAALDAGDRAALLRIAMSMAGRTPPGRVHAPQQSFRARTTESRSDGSP